MLPSPSTQADTCVDLAAALARRLPAAAEALDPGWAAERVQTWLRTRGARPAARVQRVEVGSVLYRDDGSLTLRYSLVRRDRVLRDGRDLAPPSTLLVALPAEGAGVRLHAFPDDPGLPTLRAAVTPVVAADMLRRALPGVGRERGLAACRVAVVHHPRRGACVLRYDLRPGAAGYAELPFSRVFAKVYPSAGEAGRAATVARALVRGSGRAGGSLVLPKVLAMDDRLAVLVLKSVPGRTPPPAAGVDAAARAVATLHETAASSGLPPVDREAVLAGLDGQLGVVSTVWPDVAERVDALARRGMSRGLGTAPSPLVPSHGDLTPSQLLVDGDDLEGTVGLVDLDGGCLAEPASDVGRYLAYLDAARARDGLPLVPAPSGSADRRFVETYLGSRSGAGVNRQDFVEQVRMYHSLNLALMALSAARRLKTRRLLTALSLLQGGLET